MDEFISCPQCGAPARINERFWLAGTAGLVEHLKTGCVNNHWLTPLAEMIQGARPAVLAEAVAPCLPDGEMVGAGGARWVTRRNRPGRSRSARRRRSQTTRWSAWRREGAHAFQRSPPR